MRILEVVHLRMAGDESEPLAGLLHAAAGGGVDEPEVRVYRHARMEGDLLIHLHHPETFQGTGPSELGLRLASNLRMHGLVDHSVWVGWEEPDRAAEARRRLDGE